MTGTADLVQGAVSYFAGEIPELVTCREHGGRITLEEIKRSGIDAPALLIACVNVNRMETGTRKGRKRVGVFAAYVLARDTGAEAAGPIAARLVDAVMDRLPGKRWGLDWAEAIEPETVDANNLFSANLDRHGVALWGLSWTQTYTLPTTE